MEPQKTIDTNIHGVPEVEALLQQELDTDNPVALKALGARCEAWQSRVSFQYRNAHKVLKEMRRQYLLPKSKDVTDLDRKISYEAVTAQQECLTEVLHDQQDDLRNRISFIQSLLSSAKQEMKSGLR